MSTSINDLRIYDPTAAKTPVVSDPTSTKDISQNFLKMLTVQLQNQDPMNPMDNADMTSQLAQLNTVDGINRLNTTIGSMISQMQSANFMNLSASVGKTALAAGKDVYFNGQAVSLAAKLSQAASSLVASIKDQSGQVVNQLDFGAVGAGVTDFIWDGKNEVGDTVPAGVYSLALQATDAQGQSLLPDAFVGAMVASVGMDGTDLRAGLSDGRSVLTNEILKWVMV